MNKSIKRREFLRTGLTLGGVALAGGIPIRLLAQDNRVTEDDPLAVAMGYVHDAAQTDTAKFPKRAGEEGAKQFCYNCALYIGSEEDEWAGCSIFQNREVKGAGWCNAWVAKS